MSASLPTPGQWARLCDQLEAAVARLRGGGDALLRLADLSRGGGYPRSTRFGHRGKGGVSDPVLDLVASGDFQPDSGRARTMVERLEGGLALVLSADAVVADALRPEPAGSGEVGCRAHALIGVFAAVRANSLCRWCNDHMRGTGRAPTPAELRAHEDSEATAAARRRSA